MFNKFKKQDVDDFEFPDDTDISCNYIGCIFIVTTIVLLFSYSVLFPKEQQNINISLNNLTCDKIYDTKSYYFYICRKDQNQSKK